LTGNSAPAGFFFDIEDKIRYLYNLCQFQIARTFFLC